MHASRSPASAPARLTLLSAGLGLLVFPWAPTAQVADPWGGAHTWSEQPPLLCAGSVRLADLMANRTGDIRSAHAEVSDGWGLDYVQDPPILTPDYTGRVWLRDVGVFGDVPTVKFWGPDGEETWDRARTETIGGHTISRFDLSWPANELIRFLDYGYDKPFKNVGVIDTGLLRIGIDLRVAPPDLPRAPVHRINSHVQYSSHVVNLRVDNLTERPLEGPYGTVQSKYHQAAELFSEHFRDVYDELAFSRQRPELEHLLVAIHAGIHQPVEGIGRHVFDDRTYYGLNRRIKSFTVYYRPGAMATNDVSTHETMHQWVDAFRLADLAGYTPGGWGPFIHTALLFPHESFVGAVLQHPTQHVIRTDDDVYEIATTATPRQHPLHLYAMGILPASAVPDMVVFENQSFPANGTRLSGGSRTITMSDIIAEYGPRTGPVNREWRRGTVIVSEDGLLTQEEMNYWNFFAKRVGEEFQTTDFRGVPSFYESTDGLMRLRTEIEPKHHPALAWTESTALRDYARTAWRGVEFDAPVPSSFMPNQSYTFRGRVTDVAYDRIEVCIGRWGSDSSCEWVLTTDGGRFSIARVFPEAGPHAVTIYLYDDNGSRPPSGARVTGIIVGDRRVPTCEYTLEPEQHYVTETGGGPFEVAVETSRPTCSWVAASRADFIRITGATSGIGRGTIEYHVGEHTGATTRTGTIEIGTATFAVTQFAGLAPPRTLTYGDDAGGDTDSPQSTIGGMASVAASATLDLAGLRAWDAWVNAGVRSDMLVLRARRADRQLPDRMHESLAQYHQGVPVHGGGVTRQLDRGVTVSIFGTVHGAIDVGTVPGLSPAETLSHLRTVTGAEMLPGRPPTLVIFPMPDGSYVLTYRATMNDARTYFVNAHTGRITYEVTELQAQSAIGNGIGIRGHRKKVSATHVDGTFRAIDRLRPGETLTLDVGHDDQRLEQLLSAVPGGPRWVAGDVASDADNTWEDPAVVDAHVHAGWTYDYFAQAHGYAGIDGNNGRVVGLVNNAVPASFFIRPPFGPEGAGAYVFGEAPDGTPLVAGDLVAHELMHGVTYFTVNGRTGSTHGLLDTLNVRRPDLRSFVHAGRTVTCDNFRFRYPDGLELPAVCESGRFVLFSNQGRAINEAFSDIFATAVEFFHGDAGSVPLAPDYLIGEDMPDGPYRSLANPRSTRIGGTSVRYPDAASGALHLLLGFDGQVVRWIPLAFAGDRYVGELPHTDVGGAHWNSTILSHAFYLAIEGGRNATTGQSVTGVGRQAAREVERVYFRALSELMPAYPDFSMVGAVIRQAAVDLFGDDSAVWRAIDGALTAVGL